jgi:hypothetical protein
MELSDRTVIALPLRYFWVGIGALGSVLLFTFYLGSYIGDFRTTMDSRVNAAERQIEDVNKELNFRLQIRAQIVQKLDSIEHRLSLIEGKLDGLRHSR